MKRKFLTAMDVVVCVLFAAMLVIPLATSDFQGGKISVAEKRVLAEAPDWSDPLDPAFPEAAEAWIDDNIGLRSKAQEVNTLVSWKALNASGMDDTIVGKDGWLFYYTDWIGRDFCHTNQLSKEEKDNLMYNMGLICDYIREQNAAPLLVMLPDKKTIYPEKYPDGLVVADQPSRANNVYAAAQEHKLPMMWICGRLLEAKDQGIGYVYSPRLDNAHWNNLGAYIGVEEVCKALKDLYLPSLTYVPLSECVIEEFEQTGMLNDSVEISETAYRVLTGNEGTWRDDKEYLDRFPELTYVRNPEAWKIRRVNEDSTKPSLLWVGDSYTIGMFEYLSQNFSEFTFLHLTDMSLLPEVMADVKPDAVVIEWVERQYESASLELWKLASKIWFMENPS